MLHVVFILCALANTEAAAPTPEAALARPVLTLSEALQMASDRHPQVRQAQALTQVSVAQARVQRAQLLPQLNGQAGYSRSTSNFANSPGSVPSSLSESLQPSLSRSTNYFNVGLTATQLIYDFGATYDQYTSAQATAEAQAFNERTALATVILNVRNGFFNARAAHANISVAQDNLTNQEKHKIQIDSQVRVGKRPEIDLLQARTDTSNARVQLITANANYRISLAQLNQAIGREASIDYDVADETLALINGEDTDTETLLAEALAARPDYIAAERSVLAQERLAQATRGGFGPSIAASGSLTDAGAQVDNLAWNWKAGLTLNWSLFGSGETYYAMEAADATLVSLIAARDTLRQQVRLQVEQTRLGVLGARESLEAAEDARFNAEKLLAQAEGRYSAGISSVIELGDAQVAFTKAATQKVQAEYSLASARATLLNALGRLDI